MIIDVHVGSYKRIHTYPKFSTLQLRAMNPFGETKTKMIVSYVRRSKKDISTDFCHCVEAFHSI